MGNQFIPPDVMEQVGKELPEKVMEVEKGAIRRFADAIGDNNPLYHDEEHTKKSRHGALVAPPTFIFTMTMGMAPHYQWDFGRVGIHGGEEYEYLKPIKAGDTITCKTKIADIYEKDGKRGKMAFMILESLLENQHGEVVSRIKRTRIRME
jgi:acyl dehydratase